MLRTRTMGYDGHAPIGAYLSEHGWCVGPELRSGVQHSQSDFGFCLDRVLACAKALAGAQKRLAPLDREHDAAANREQFDGENVDYRIKRNPQGEDPLASSARANKRIATSDETVEWTFE